MLMQNNQRPWLVAGLLLLALSGGCQTFRRSRNNADSGPSRSFGLDYVPPQSEPPVEGADAGAKAGSKSPAVQAASLEEPNDEGSAKPVSGLKRLLPGRDKDSPKSKPLPVSSRSASAEDSAAGGQDDEN
jgi:hypothetical protein